MVPIHCRAAPLSPRNISPRRPAPFAAPDRKSRPVHRERVPLAHAPKNPPRADLRGRAPAPDALSFVWSPCALELGAYATSFSRRLRRNRLAPHWRFLDLLVRRNRQAEQPRRIQPENVALGLFAEERQRSDRVRQIEIPVRPVGREQKLGFRLDRVEGRLGEL